MLDDKSEHCIPFILDGLQRKFPHDTQRSPFFVGLNGAQGSGKTTLVSTLAEKLRQPPHSLSTVVLSIDDLYLPHNLQSELAATHPTNPLIQHRGQPSTHDLPLAVSLFSDLRNGNQTRIPSYDKSAFNGQGDRTPIEKWSTVNEQGDSNIKIVIFEGWCVGFRAMPEFKLKIQWEDAIKQRENAEYQGRLGYNKLEDVEYVNEALKDYDQLTNELDALIHIDATDEHFVYSWRLQQEAVLRKTRGAGMTDEQVINFVDGYYPAYELFTDSLRAGAFSGEEGRQLRIVVGKDRKVREVRRI